MSEDVTLDKFVEKRDEKENQSKHTLPDDWQIYRADEIMTITRGASPRPKGDPELFGGNIPWVKIGDVDVKNARYTGKTEDTVTEKGAKKSKLVEEGTLIVSNSGTCGYPMFVGRQSCVHDGWLIIRDYGDKLNPYYLYEYVNWKQNYLKSLAPGSTQINLNTSRFGVLEINTPPIPEQRKIATVLYTVEQAIKKTESVIEQIQRIKDGTIEQLITKGVEHNEYKKLDISPKFLEVEVPQTWKKVSYDDVSENITYGFTNPMPEADTGPWMVTAKDIKGGKINYDTARKTTQEAFSNKLTDKSRPEIGTVLITKDGTLGNVGIVDKENICINQSVASIKPIQEMVMPEFLTLVLQSSFTKKLIESYNPQTTIGHIKITELAKWEFGLPPIEEQRKIVSIVDSIQKTLDSEEEHKDYLINIKNGLMQDLLSGTVRTTDINIQVPDEVAQHG